MTLNEYQVLAYRTTNHELTNQGLIENGVMGLCGEAGECIDLVKKNPCFRVTTLTVKSSLTSWAMFSGTPHSWRPA